ncbi:MAG: glycosyltransferase family 2 protein [Candidatus Moranbacteria bacterium]|nr:glycosyltransferase family 2 protein [Candidatus Moranbacteria bacterium]
MKLLDWRWWLGMKPKIVSVPPEKDYTITVIIPAYNEERSIRRTIGSVKAQTAKIDEIIVVDDCSSDKTGEFSRQMRARVIRTPVNQGTKAQAQNFALPYVKTELVATIDADTVLAKDAIEKTLPYFNDPLTASVCGFVIPQRIKTVWERGRFIEYVFGISIFKAGQNNMGAVLVSSGCFSVFRAELLQEFGGFKARTMAEDMDLTWEFSISGYRIYCDQRAYCFPADPPTLRIFVNQVDRWTRSFLQNVSIHSFRKNKKLGAFIYGYLIESLLSPFILLAGCFLITKNIIEAIALSILAELALVSVPCLIKGARIGLFWKTLTSIPAYFVIRPVNFYVFWRSLWKEWIVRERLSSWNKGH